MELNSENIKKLDPHADLNCTVLSLACKNIGKIHENVFQPFVNVKEIHLSFNRLESLPEQLFRHNLRLERVTLQSNSIVCLPGGLLRSLLELKDFQVHNNRIEVLSENFFENNHKLTKIDISGNLITSFHPSLVNHLTKLKVFNFDENKVKILEFPFLAPRTVLQLYRYASKLSCIYVGILLLAVWTPRALQTAWRVLMTIIGSLRILLTENGNNRRRLEHPGRMRTAERPTTSKGPASLQLKDSRESRRSTASTDEEADSENFEAAERDSRPILPVFQMPFSHLREELALRRSDSDVTSSESDDHLARLEQTVNSKLQEEIAKLKRENEELRKVELLVTKQEVDKILTEKHDKIKTDFNSWEARFNNIVQEEKLKIKTENEELVKLQNQQKQQNLLTDGKIKEIWNELEVLKKALHVSHLEEAQRLAEMTPVRDTSSGNESFGTGESTVGDSTFETDDNFLSETGPVDFNETLDNSMTDNELTDSLRELWCNLKLFYTVPVPKNLEREDRYFVLHYETRTLRDILNKKFDFEKDASFECIDRAALINPVINSVTEMIQLLLSSIIKVEILIESYPAEAIILDMEKLKNLLNGQIDALKTKQSAAAQRGDSLQSPLIKEIIN